VDPGDLRAALADVRLGTLAVELRLGDVLPILQRAGSVRRSQNMKGSKTMGSTPRY